MRIYIPKWVKVLLWILGVALGLAVAFVITTACLAHNHNLTWVQEWQEWGEAIATFFKTLVSTKPATPVQ